MDTETAGYRLVARGQHEDEAAGVRAEWWRYEGGKGDLTVLSVRSRHAVGSVTDAGGGAWVRHTGFPTDHRFESVWSRQGPMPPGTAVTVATPGGITTLVVQ